MYIYLEDTTSLFFLGLNWMLSFDFDYSIPFLFSILVIKRNKNYAKSC